MGLLLRAAMGRERREGNCEEAEGKSEIKGNSKNSLE